MTISSLINPMLGHQTLEPLSTGWYLGVAADELSLYERVRAGAKPPKAASHVQDYTVNGSARVIAQSPTGDHVAVGSDASPFLYIYAWDEGTETITPVTGVTAPPGAVIAATYSHTGRFLALALSAPPYVAVYERSGSTYTQLGNPVPPGTGGEVSVLDSYRIRAANLSTLWRGWQAGSFGTLLTAPSVYDVDITYTRTDNGEFYWGSPTSGMKTTLAGCYLVVDGYGAFAIDAASEGISTGTFLHWPAPAQMVNNTEYDISILDGPPDGPAWFPSDMHEATTVAFNADDSQLVLGFQTTTFIMSFEVFDIVDGTDGPSLLSTWVNMVDGTDGPEPLPVLTAPALGSAFTPDGSMVLISNFNGVQAFAPDATEGPYAEVDVPFEIPTGDESVWAITFSPDGNRMALGLTALADSGALLYDQTSPGVWTQVETAFPDFPDTAVRGLAFSADGRYIAAALADSPHFVVYRVRSVPVFERLPDPEVIPAGTGFDVAFLMKA